MHQLSRREAGLLAAETVNNIGHHSLYLELASDEDGNVLSVSRLREMLTSRLHQAPSLRRRIREVPLGLDHPWWIEDPHFDLNYHVRHIAVPGASDPDALEQLLGRLHERPLDRSRPLWELYLIDHPGGKRSLFFKVHVVISDAMGPLGALTPVLVSDVVERIGSTTAKTNTINTADTFGLASQELDEGEIDGYATDRWRADMVPTDSDLLIKAGWSTLHDPVRAGLRTLDLAQRVPVIGRLALLAVNAVSRVPHPVEKTRGDHPVPRTAFNRTLGSHRAVAQTTLDMGRLRQAHKQNNARFHEVFLGMIAGAVRHWLQAHDDETSESLVALTPLLLDPDAVNPADRLGAALVPIGTNEADPKRRLIKIGIALDDVIDQLGPRSVPDIRASGALPSALAGVASQMLLTTNPNLRLMPPFNLYVVNIPGLDGLMVDRFAVTAQHALCPLIDGIGLSVSAISLGDQIHVTFVADSDLVDDLGSMATQLERELELLES